MKYIKIYCKELKPNIGRRFKKKLEKNIIWCRPPFRVVYSFKNYILANENNEVNYRRFVGVSDREGKKNEGQHFSQKSGKVSR